MTNCIGILGKIFGHKFIEFSKSGKGGCSISMFPQCFRCGKYKYKKHEEFLKTIKNNHIKYYLKGEQ
jgi:hypothetical protein